MKRGESGINCLLAIDKPVGPSSHDVVNRVRRALGERRVGHAGTLDPMASGVLVVGVGQGARLLGMLTLDEKAYEATIAFGTETTTDDAEGEVTTMCAVPAEVRDEAFATACVSKLVGTFKQVPPSFSAISVNGRRAYDRARSGEEVALPPREVTVHEAELRGVSVDGDDVIWTVYLRVSKGTYVRSIARDLGRALGSAAHLTALRRVASGSIDIERCLGLEELEREGRSALDAGYLDPVFALGHPFRVLAPQERDDVACGRRVEAGLCVDAAGAVRPPERDELVSLVADGSLVGIWRRIGPYLICESNFPTGIVGVGR